MAAPSARKAALLLMGLDAATAAELLRTLDPATATELVADVAYLDAAGFRKKENLTPSVREFCGMLSKGKGSTPGGEKFLKDMLEGAMGRDKAKDILSHLKELVVNRDPFMAVRCLEVADLTKALEGESAQVAAMVLSELPAKKCTDLLTLLPDAVRLDAVRALAAGETPSAEVRKRVADLVMSRLQSPAVAGQASPAKHDGQLRKVSICLRGLPTELRTSMLKAIVETDKAVGDAIKNLMVTWEDIVAIADRSLQEVLRTVESKKLALALVGADPATTKKIRANMSERAAAMLEEEGSLLSNPKQPDILKAREEFLKNLRELYQNNMLNFIEA